MSWFFIALAGPLLWGAVNHIDKYLLEKHFKSVGVGALVVYSSLFGGLVLPILFLIDPGILDVTFSHLFLLLGSGIVSGLGIIFYLYAINEAEATVVVPFFQLIPVFSYIFGYIFLGETLSSLQITAGGIIMIGATLLTIEIEREAKYRIRAKLALLMVSSAAFFSFYEALFKAAALKESFWVSSFWTHVGLLIIGVIIFIFSKARKDFLLAMRTQSKKIFGLNMFSEGLTIVGNMLVAYATLLAPLALVGLVNAYQPLFVFLVGLILTKFFPQISTEKITGWHLWQKIISIVLILGGSYLL